MKAITPPPSEDRQARYWLRTRRLTAVLGVVWFATTFGTIFFARELSQFTLFGWQLSYYLAAQGTILIYVAIVALYARRMRGFDRRHAAEDINDA